ncbi:hypothetical protein [Paraglaciecola polaris]|uniref:Uncharacterized protein n=1 Tax=Paraglaciecola polaris LMG 21857 TaxID=1129793 RepID=K6Z8J9_9ALTE|nr:hypothetical protein [Paraglaciecola polaris]GAC32496.1 hypothetical protein GPLA_1582 [Paraglaciecola polaris LMG 21857]
MPSALSAQEQEWITLQNQYDSYEKLACAIKLVCISVVAFMLLLHASSLLVAAIIAVFWLQEAVWKTFQGRIEARLLILEATFSSDGSFPQQDVSPMQFNLQWAATRPGILGLVAEYGKSALRPTVALHYVLLLLVVMAAYLQLFTASI